MRELITVPNPCLRRQCEPVKVIDSYIRDLVTELLALLASKNAPIECSFGIAAPQLGECIQLFVISTQAVTLVALNPVIVKIYGQHDWIEGCLSLPGRFYKVNRPKLIKFQYMDLNGQMRSGKFHDDYAGVVQHEMQHLSGIMIDTFGIPVSRKLIFQP